jgi:hypothetical protein
MEPRKIRHLAYKSEKYFYGYLNVEGKWKEIAPSEAVRGDTAAELHVELPIRGAPLILRILRALS